MRFYHIKQFGKQIISHEDKAFSKKKGLKEVCNRVVAKALEAVEDGLMIVGAFEVVICDKYGKELDNFVSGTDYVY